MRLRVACGVVLLAIWGVAAPASRALGQDATALPNQLFGIEVHGFVSPGFVLSTDNEWLPHSTRGTPEFSEVGVNFTRAITDELRFGVQLFARDLGRVGNYSAKFDWFYLDYRFANWLGLRAGRVKIPFGLYNETNDVDAARVPILLPQSIYPISNRDFLLAQTGGELYGYLSHASLGSLEYRIYGGTILLEANDSPAAPYDVLSVDTTYLVGGRVLVEPLSTGVRLGGSVQWLRLDSELLYDPATTAALITSGAAPAGWNGRLDIELPAFLWVASAEYTHGALLLAAEYSRWVVDVHSKPAGLFPAQKTTSERLYGMASYVVTTWLTPGVYYALQYPDVENRDGKHTRLPNGSTVQQRGRAWVQHDVALTLRFDINSYWLVKLEGHYMRGTAQLSPELNDAKPRTDMDPSWLLFLAKTTLYF
jgi:hypothetical protein